MRVRCVDGSIFEEGFEAWNFWVADEEGVCQINATSALIQDLKPRIQAAMHSGAKHLDVSKLEVVHSGVKVLEIQWC